MDRRGELTVLPDLRMPDDEGTTVMLVEHRGRPLGAYVTSGGQVRFEPVVDVTRLAAAGLAGVAVVAATALLTRRHVPAIGRVSMGPGGWVSLRGAKLPALRPTGAPRPWWARVLRARRLVVQ